MFRWRAHHLTGSPVQDQIRCSRRLDGRGVHIVRWAAYGPSLFGLHISKQRLDDRMANSTIKFGPHNKICAPWLSRRGANIMFTNDQPTVFILGAGASWHYGYPTGEELVRKARVKAGILANYYEYSAKNGNPSVPKFIRHLGEDTRSQWQNAHQISLRMQRGLDVANPLVIDYFLGLNPELQDIGRLLIAWTILECEHKSGRHRTNINRHAAQEIEDDWCRFVTHKLTLGCLDSDDLLRNKVSFVTFNYDGSLERRLGDSLRQIQILQEEDIKKFLSGTRIVHVYGRIGHISHHSLNWSIQDVNPFTIGDFNARATYHGDICTLLENIYGAATDIRVIDPHNKGSDADIISIARRQIAEAQRVFILGYGFDESNNERLMLVQNLKAAPKKRVYFTNFDNNANVNKRVSQLLTGNITNFRGESNVHETFERSTRNVYDAFARDFDL
jgi:hypothetical protein